MPSAAWANATARTHAVAPAVARRVEHRPARARRDCSVHERERRGLEAQLRGRITQLAAESRDDVQGQKIP